MADKAVKERQRIVVRFAGDSGDGMQLTGDRFTNATAVLGNDLATLPDFPAEIRAPAGTVHGVSAFQIQFASTDILTPGDHPNVLVAMNPAALKAELGTVERGGTIIVNEDAFNARNLEKAGFAADPLGDGTLEGYQVYRVPMTSITVRAVEELGLTRKEAERSKNMFALGLLSWMYGRPVDVTLNWLLKNFGVITLQAEDEIAAANVALGAAFAGDLGVTGTSGPGMDLKAETLGLAVTLELPMVVVDVQRAGPSTGMPTKTEQADLLLAMFGRHGEAPLPIVAAATPAECFDMVIEASRIALKYRTPVIFLSDAFLATGSEPWKLPDVSTLPDLSKEFAFATEPNAEGPDGPEFWPFVRDP